MSFENIEASVIPYNQQEVEVLLKQLLLKNGVTDVLYEGSNVSQLMSVISYAISTLNVNTAINLQETLLPLATKRMNILMGARQLGYEPHNKLSYKYEIQIIPHYNSKAVYPPNHPQAGEINITDDTEEIVFDIVSGTKFKDENNTYYYLGPTIKVQGIYNKDITDAKRTGIFQKDRFPKITVIEGELIRSDEDPALTFEAIDYLEDNKTKTKQDYIIPFRDLEHNEGITAYLTYIDENGKFIQDEKWTRSKQILIDETLSYQNNKFIRMENIILGYPAIFFEYAGVGKGIRSKTQIKVDVLVSKGKNGKATGKFIVDDTRASEIFYVHSNFKMVQQGSDEESNEHIKEHAPVFNNTANRAVTKLDYIAIASAHPEINQAYAWGGEEETPQVKGEIWVSATPSNQTRPISQNIAHGTTRTQTFKIETGSLSQDPSEDYEAQRNFRNWYITDEQWKGSDSLDSYGRNIHQPGIKDYLDTYKIMTMGLNHRHPFFIEFHYKMRIIKYDLKKSPEKINTKIFNQINEFFLNIEKFNTEYLNSNFQRVIDQSLGERSGINYTLALRGVLCEEMIDEYYHNTGNDKILVTLAWPFENLLPQGKNGPIDTSVLPKIDTKNFNKFASAPEDLTVDFTTLPTTGTLREADIKLGTTTVGKYRINLKENIITLEFDFTVLSKDEVFGTEKTAPNGSKYRDYAYVDIVYPPGDPRAVNIPFNGNVLPRLGSVEFTY